MSQPVAIPANPSDDPQTPGQIILGWWSINLADRQSGRARALAARLRRASVGEALIEPEIFALAKKLNCGPGDGARMARLVTLLAEVRSHTTQTLMQRLGGDEPTLSKLRFQRLMRAEDEELVEAVRRAIRLMDDPSCNVAALGESLFFWGEKTRAKWCFEYFG